MAFAMTIGGTDVMPYLDVESLRLTSPLNARHTLSARFEDAAGSYRPALLAEIIFTDDGDRLFAGYVTDPRESDFAADVGIATDLTAADYSVRLDHLYLTLAIEAGESLRDVVDAVWAEADIEADFGIERDAGMAAGPTLEAQTFTDASVTAILNHLSTLSGWPWRVTYDKVLVMAEVGTEAAPATLQVGTTALVLGEAAQTLAAYGNRQTVRIGTGEHDVADTFNGDDVETEWPLTYTTARTYGYVTVNPGGTFLPLGIVGEDEAATWNWDRDANTLVQTGTPLATGSSVVITYVGAFPLSITAVDAGEVTARGRWDRAPVDLPDEFDYDAGLAFADALIRRYAVWPPPRTIRVVIWTAGFFAGQEATLVDSVRDLSGAWLIVDRDVTVRNGMFLEYTLTLIEGDEQQAGFREYWRGLGGSGGGASTLAGGVVIDTGGGGGAGSGIYEATLGGSASFDVVHSTWANVGEYRDWVCPADGFYWCRVQVWTSHAGTSVTPRVYDVTASAAAQTGSASTSTSREEQILGFTAVAAHRYRLQVLPGNTSAGVFGLGIVETADSSSGTVPTVDGGSA